MIRIRKQDLITNYSRIMSIVYSSRNNRKATATTIIGNTQCQPYNTAGQGYLSLVLVVHNRHACTPYLSRIQFVLTHSSCDVRILLYHVTWKTYARKVASLACGQLNKDTYFPFPRSHLRTWSRETGSAVPSRVNVYGVDTASKCFVDHLSLTIKPCPLDSLVQGFLERARRMNPCRGG